MTSHFNRRRRALAGRLRRQGWSLQATVRQAGCGDHHGTTRVRILSESSTDTDTLVSLSLAPSF